MRLRMFSSRLRRLPGGSGIAVVVTGALVSTFLGTAVAAPAVAAPAKAKAKVVDSRPDAVAAMMAARMQHSRVEVLNDRTDAAQTFANPNGSFSYSVSAQPRWVKRGGSWRSLDATLTWTNAHTLVPAVSESPLVLSGGGSGPLATMTVNGLKMSVSWPSVLPKPKVSGATATYANVLPSGVDLQVTATAAGGVEETLIVKNAKAAADPALASLTQATATSGGAKLSADAGGNLTFKDSHGRALITSPAPVMWDSNTTQLAAPVPAGARVAAPAYTPAVSTASSSTRGPGLRARVARVRVALAGHRLALTPDRALLTGKTTTYPVFIDPAYVPHPASGSTLHYDEVQQAYPTVSNYGAAPGSGLAVGYQGFSSPTGIERTFYNLSIPSSIYGAHIISAKLNTTVTYAAASGSNSTTVNAFSTGTISSSTTWNTQPGKSTGATNPNYPSPNAAATFTTTSSSPNLPVSFNVTSGMQDIASIKANNWTLGLYNATETNDVDLVRFAANPTFSITYNNPPATPSNLSMTPSNTVGSTTYTSTGTPTLSASATDANSDTVQLDYQVLSGTTVKASGNTAFVTSGTAATWKPSSALADGAYTWQVRAYDGADYSAWTTAKAFTIDTTTAPAPSVNCSGYPKGVWTPAISGGTSCTLSDTATDVMGYSWGLDSGTGNWTSGTSPTITINPPAGYHTLWVSTFSNANKQGTETYYSFGVGSAGMTAPNDQATTSTTFPLQAAAPPGSAKVTFQYRKGTTGSFTTIPAGDVTNGSSAVTWPVATTSTSSEVQSPSLTWNVTHTLNNDGLVQIEAVFTDSSGNNPITTQPVSVTLDRIGTGVDFGTTQAGPVTVGLQSGNASVSANDVSIASYGSGLGVTRTFNSLKPTVNTGFGPGWTTSLPVAGTSASWASVTDDGSYALLTGQDGSELTFTAGTASNGTTPYIGQGPAAASGLTLTKTSAGFTLTDTGGTQITLVLPSGGIGGRYLPSTVTQPGSGKSTGYVYDGTSTSATYGKLILMVAPDAASTQPSTTACPYPATSSSWTAGCRGLQFSYDSTTGNISEMDFVTSDGTTLTKKPVAQYSYDSAGRLAAEWDPRISPALKTTYTYNENGTSDPDNGRLTQISPAQSTTGSLAPWVLNYNDTATSPDYGKVASVSRTHNSANGGGAAKTVVAYSVPLTVATGGPANMDWQTTATWGQTDIPISAVAVFPPDHTPTSNPPSDWTYAQILYYDANGREVNTASYNNGWNITTTEYDQYGNTIRDLTAANRATALAAGSQSTTVATQLDTENLYTSDGTELTDTYGPAHQAMAAGNLQTIRTHTHNVYDQGAPNNDQDANGNPYQLVTSETVSASLGTQVPGSSDVDARTTQNLYSMGSDNTGWTLHTPLQTITDPGTGHLNIVQTSAFNESSSLYGGQPLPISSSQPSDTSGTGAGTTKTVYYTAGSNAADAACGNQSAWTDLVCKTEPAAQPGTSGLAGLAVTQYTYNTNLKPLNKTQTYTAADGTTATRTTTTTYDAAGRQVGSSITTSGSGMGAPVAPTKIVYDAATGLPTDTQSLDSGGSVTSDLNTTYDDFGQTSSYTDASGQVTHYTTDLTGRVISRSDSTDTTTYTYNSTTDHDGSLTGETDTKAGTFGATYNPNGDLATETYPGGITGTYSYDPTGTATALSYANSAWSNSISDSVNTNTYGDWTARAVLSGSQTYGYDAADRLTTVADTQMGQCTSRSYTYDANSNRTSLATGAAAADGSCQTGTTSAQTHTYDSADRLTDTGYQYDTLGDVTLTPSVNAGGTGDLSAGYYSNGMVANQTQAGRTMTWALDAAGNRFASYTNSASGTTTTNHYADSTDSPNLVTDSSGGWTRNVTVLNSLAAVVTASGVTLELVDLQGSVMASVDAAANSVTATYTYTEFGTPESGTTSSYGWLGGDLRSSADLGGQILMGARSYNPALGRYAAVDPVAGGSANAYDYVNQNPITNLDLSGQWCLWSCHNYSGHHWHWWGLELDFSYHRATNLEFVLGAAAGFTTIAAAVAGIIPGGQLASGLLWALDGAEGIYASWIGWELYNHPNHGVTININWYWNVWVGHE